jgi:DNA invertase Pin-like site-specific DNA recombinase
MDAPPSQPVRALGYVSVPADGPLAPASGRQARAIEAACAARGWAFVGGVREPEPVKGKAVERPGLEHALKRLQRGEANCLVVAELRRLTRSVVELGELIDRLGRAGVRLVVLDLEIDTGTEGGRMAASALATVGGWEHERVADRTRKGLPAARARGYNRHSRDTAGATGPMPGAVQTDRRTPGAVTPTGDHDAVTWTEGDAE